MKALTALLLVLGSGCTAAATAPSWSVQGPSGPTLPQVTARLETLTLEPSAKTPAPSPEPEDGPAAPLSAEWTRLVGSSATPPSSARLASGLFNPMPGGQLAGYRIDTGLDIAGSPRVVHAIADGTLEYSEPGHTRWTGPGDNANCIRVRLDEPIAYKGRRVTHVWYAHLSALRWIQQEGSGQRTRVRGGEPIGVSGKARGMPHLHLGLLLDDEVEQEWGTYLLEHEVREVLGGYKNFARLPS